MTISFSFLLRRLGHLAILLTTVTSVLGCSSKKDVPEETSHEMSTATDEFAGLALRPSEQLLSVHRAVSAVDALWQDQSTTAVSYSYIGTQPNPNAPVTWLVVNVDGEVFIAGRERSSPYRQVGEMNLEQLLPLIQPSDGECSGDRWARVDSPWFEFAVVIADRCYVENMSSNLLCNPASPASPVLDHVRSELGRVVSDWDILCPR